MSQAHIDLTNFSLLKNKSEHRINTVKLHPRSFEAIILPDCTLRKAWKISMAQLWTLYPLIFTKQVWASCVFVDGAACHVSL